MEEISFKTNRNMTQKVNISSQKCHERIHGFKLFQSSCAPCSNTWSDHLVFFRRSRSSMLIGCRSSGEQTWQAAAETSVSCQTAGKEELTGETWKQSRKQDVRHSRWSRCRGRSATIWVVWKSVTAEKKSRQEQKRLSFELWEEKNKGTW